MGSCWGPSSRSWADVKKQNAEQAKRDQYKFEVCDIEKGWPYMIADLRYPECSEFGGHKILVFEGVHEAELRGSKFVDPHFCEEEIHVAPIARFPATDRGWAMARAFVNALGYTGLLIKT